MKHKRHIKPPGCAREEETVPAAGRWEEVGGRGVTVFSSQNVCPLCKKQTKKKKIKDAAAKGEVEVRDARRLWSPAECTAS